MSMQIGHVALQVHELQTSADHARETFGLRRTEAGDGSAAYLTANDKHHELELIASSRAGLDHIGLEVESAEELGIFRDRIVSSGATMLSVNHTEPGLTGALRVLAPGGIVFEIYAAMTREPLSLENALPPLARKLGHLTLFSAEKPALERFILEVLGFRVSDRIGDFGTWMRCGPDHHGLAVGQATEGTRLHHYAFELEGWATVEVFADRVAKSGQQLLWGPGRHGPGFNVFTYLADPGGGIGEAYTDLLRIENDAAYRPIDWSTEPRALNLWGPQAPPGWNELGLPALPAATSASF
jgi:catechol 2,3-dioxygenase